MAKGTFEGAFDAERLRTPSTRDPRLDGLKGLAVVALVTTHVLAFLTFDDTDPLQHPLLMTLIGGVIAVLHGNAAIILSFVLTGYLLATSVRRNPRPLTVLVRSAVRLLPALWGAVVGAFLIFIFIRPTAAYPDPTDFLLAATRVPRLWDLVLNLSIYDGRIILPTWVMVPIATGTVAVLTFAMVSSRVGAAGRLALFAATVWLTFAAGRHMGSVLYLFCFLAGAWLVTEVVAPLLRLRVVAQTAALAGLIMLCCDVAALPTTGLLTMRLWYTAGAVLLLAALVSQPHVWSWLAWPPLQRFGLLSTSFYLIYLPVIYAVSVGMYASPIPFGSGVAGNFQIYAIGMPVSFLAAEWFQTYIERPSVGVCYRAVRLVRDVVATRGAPQDPPAAISENMRQPR